MSRIVRVLSVWPSCIVAAFALLGPAISAAAESTLEYNRDIRPILAENCFACHGADSAARKADLRLDQRELAVELGAISPQEPGESELIARILTDDPDLLMPPPETKKSLTAEQKETLQEWIAAGAEYQPHWSYIPPQHPSAPELSADESWVRNAIDRFVIARLRENGLAPAPEASPRTIFRRVHLDITGLPPKPDDVETFVAEYELNKDLALSNWIDRLMKSSAWGEHRARYWLDAARYADTHGLHFDNYREMWPYRDWVIRAFNANKPFDEFVVEQLAGDLLPNSSDDQLIATGLQRCNITTNEGGTIDEENLAIYAADRVQTFGWVFLGLTTNCAQCHDHKFDPLTMRDYYSLAAFFRNTKAPAKDGNVKDGRGPVLAVPSEEDRPRWAAIREEIAAAESRRDARKEEVTPVFESWLATVSPGDVGEIPSNGLVTHVPLNEGASAQVRNLAGYPEFAQATGPISWLPDGKLGAAPVITTDGTFDLGNQGDFEKDQPFSFGAWVKAESLGTNAAILARMDQGQDHRGWDLWQSGTEYAVHFIDTWDTNALKVKTDIGIVTPDQWQHVFVTYDGSGKASGVQIYLGGEKLKVKSEIDRLSDDASIRSTTPLRIGRRSHGNVFQGGSVQDVRIYDRELSGEEVKRITKIAAVSTILAKAAAERSEAERKIVFDYYLATKDDQYANLSRLITALEKEREAIHERSAITHVQREKNDSLAMANILMRGAYDQPGEEVKADTPAALHPMPEGAPRNRLGLAQWVVDPANPLTARVTVNRFWLELFGQGLVATAEDFGVSGVLPSHPELLDWLAIEFRESGWDVQHLFKLMLMSATYRQASTCTTESLQKDPDNMLFSRGPRFRMDAEMVRDYALAVSGLLSPRMYGPGTKPYQPDNIWNMVGLPEGNTRVYKQDTGENLYRRTVYNFWKRMAPPPNMEAFNAPSREVCTIQRERTNTPLQALVTLNDPQFVEASRRLAEQLLRDSPDTDQHKLQDLSLRVLSRPLTTEELTILKTAKNDFFEFYHAHPEAAQQLIATGESKPDQDLEAETLATWSMICSQVLNLDEALNK